MIPLFKFLASGSVAVTTYNAAAKSINFALEASAVVSDIKHIARSGNFPFTGPILTSGTIPTVCFVLI